jgi:glycerol-3-phosphate O-acyltransferase / dihydroxyacetone phosphate acyltransferase
VAFGSGSEFSDCERRNDGFLEQDVNAWSSLAYVAIGLIIAREVWTTRLPRAAGALAVVVTLEGVGSWLYHGEAGDVSQALHDVPLIGMLAYVAGWHVGRLFDIADRLAVVATIIGMAIGAVLFAVSSGSTNPVVGMLVVVTVAAELVASRRHIDAVWTMPVVVLVAVALAFWVAGTSASPVCEPDTWLQPHAVWHVLTAVLALVWIDRSTAVLRPERPPLLLRRGTDRVLGTLAFALTHVFHRSVDVRWRERFPSGRPVLIVANHGNGFVDPIVVTAALGTLPRFLAKAALWNVVAARPLLAIAGVLPVYRSGDGDRSSDNRSVFEACHRDLAQGSTVAIFPEGTTGDRAGLDRVRSGAARIALGALATAPDLVIVPIGLAFESRVETRSRTVVMFGEPIEVAPHVTTDADDVDTQPNRDDVAELNRAIAQSLEDVSPSFASVDEREMLRAAARTERNAASRGGTARFGDIEVVARTLAAADDAEKAHVIDCYRCYATRLTLVELDERQVNHTSMPWLRLAVSAAAIVLAGPLLVTVTLIFLPALLLVVVATGLVESTATKGTVRFLVGLATGLATCIVAGIVIGDGFGALVASAAVAVGGGVALVVWPPIVRTIQTLIGRLTARDRGSLMRAVHADRDALIAAVRSASMTP